MEERGKWRIEPNNELALQPGKVRFRVFPDVRSFLWTKDEYADFILKLEFKVEPKSRSGVLLRSSSLSSYMEIQICDSSDKTVPMKADDCGALAKLVAPSKNASKPAGQWNQMTIHCEGSHLDVQLNAETVLDLDLADISSTKGLKSGRIGLQNQNEAVSFRNIRIKVLPAS